MHHQSLYGPYLPQNVIVLKQLVCFHKAELIVGACRISGGIRIPLRNKRNHPFFSPRLLDADWLAQDTPPTALNGCNYCNLRVEGYRSLMRCACGSYIKHSAAPLKKILCKYAEGYGQNQFLSIYVEEGNSDAG
jgi:hypothetical protein